ncbi:hypothetical protein SARC_11228 [Sphaeroforma arctica JP610]|uniref:Uncharacterized protein n=1 Tax=Sphaeroforma arctica JP610 TaxID=667725 RepID=A0A0L0FHN5_9EUKA|nr:hypothetical protein SARC_11228 [Sphaeroforma arctica JP610]KNC76265.1 hypothetical protein SARC_11228 [Sphaeroforma arctica JP610]|eukprot:XP_014150167.1 hypothetical protein SARC_11228 [Sphaeroforma arctica JP610]
MERIQQTSLQTDQNAKDLHEITRQYTGALDEELGTALTCNKRVVSATRGAHKKVTEGMHKLRTDLNAEYTTMAEIVYTNLYLPTTKSPTTYHSITAVPVNTLFADALNRCTADEHLTAYEDASAECNQMAIKDLETVAGRMDVCGTTTKAHRSTAEGMVTQLTADINAQKRCVTVAIPQAHDAYGI